MRSFVVLLAALTVVAVQADSSFAAGQCRALKGARLYPGGQTACTARGAYRCEKGPNGWRWVRFAAFCPHLDPRPGQATPAPAPG